MPSIEDYLREVISNDGSDLHYVAGNPPRYRQYGLLEKLSEDNLDPDEVSGDLYEIMPPRARAEFEHQDGADFAHSIEGLARFRVNVFRHIGGMGGIFRAIPSEAKTLVDLNMPAAVVDLCKHNSGLILVTGKTGSGKSTTLAAMVDAMNKRMKGHILTIEDPIEFVHQRKGCLISQREVGVHSKSFSAALHSALREDPDVILVGELRDLETMGIAVTAAEMGILVLGTLHTNGAAPTVDRMVHGFPADKQDHIRAMLSTSLRGVISQQLVRRKDGKGRVAALEIMINTSAVANLLRQGKLDQLENAMQSGAQFGMCTMDGSLMKLYEQAMIGGMEAYQQANNKEKFEKIKAN